MCRPESLELSLFGRLFQPTWARLAQAAEAQATTVVLSEPVDGEPGQQLVVVTSAQRDCPFAFENEVRTITAVAGATVHLDAPLTYRHYGGPEYQVSGVELEGLGQQNHLGRYPFHFHFADSASGSYFTDSSVWHSNWRGVVIHHTNELVVSFNLAAGIKILGPTDPASLAELDTFDQAGFTVMESAELTQPLDRAAEGFYFPIVPVVDAVVPLAYGVSRFDGNSASSSSYFWERGGCLYAGGVLSRADVGGVPKLKYQSGRTTEWDLLRHTRDTFHNTRTFLCTVGITHWGNEVRIVNFEAWDDELMAQVFGACVQASMREAPRGGGEHSEARHQS